MSVRAIGAGVALLAVVGLLAGCAVVDPGDPVTDVRQIDSVSSVRLDGAGRLTVVTGASPSVTVTAGERVIDRITTTASNGRLTIGHDGWFPLGLGSVDYEVVVPELETLRVNGAASVDADFSGAESVTISIDGAAEVTASSIDAHAVRLSLKGAGSVTAPELETDALTAAISGAGTIGLTGTADAQSVSIDGVGKYRGDKVKGQTADVSIDGAGKASLAVSSSLDVSVDGAGSVTYSGNPDVSRSISGAGFVKRVTR